MFLRSIAIKNYRSLEDVKLDKLDRFNVLIGRNNSGKSSVFGALQLVNSVSSNAPIEGRRVLTDLDEGRSLEICLTFDSRDGDREEFFDLLYATPDLERRREEVRKSPLLRQVEYLFRAPAGYPEYLRPHQIRVLTEDGQWAVVQRIMNTEVGAAANSRVTDMSIVRANYSGYVLSASLSDVDRSSATHPSLATSMDLRAQTSDPATMWPWEKLKEFFRNAFFFDPFRHSVESAAAQQTPELAQDGSNLPQALHTINSNNRQTFQEIERFVQAALPDVGVLQTPLEGTATRVSFLRAAGGYEVRLYDMGSGIEQLLMSAMVLLTAGDRNALFLEEPETHLHAGAQRFLMEQLYDGDRQIFISTHSPTFINFPRFRSLYRIMYSNERTRKDLDAVRAGLTEEWSNVLWKALCTSSSY